MKQGDKEREWRLVSLVVEDVDKSAATTPFQLGFAQSCFCWREDILIVVNIRQAHKCCFKARTVYVLKVQNATIRALLHIILYLLFGFKRESGPIVH